MNRIKKGLLIVAGFLLLGIACIGMFVPILPTTPLCLLALACFANGSDRIHNWFVGTKIYKRYLENYVTTKSMPLKTKLGICIPVTGMLAITAVLIDNTVARIGIVVLALAMHFCFIFIIRTAKAEDNKE